MMLQDKNGWIFPQIQSVFFENKYVDVTGGMKKKVEIALSIAKLGVKSHIIGRKNLRNTLLGNKFFGTVVV